MLTPAEVIPFLVHEEGFVRLAAGRYLAEAHDPAPATAEDVWRGIERFGMWGAAGLVGNVAGLPQTEDSLWRAMGALAGTLDGRARDYLEEAVESVGIDLLVQYREELLGGLQLSEESKGYLRARLELREKSAGEMWERLMALGTEERPDEEEAYRLVEAIGARGDADVIGEAMEVLADDAIVDWREVFAVDVLGEVRHEGAVDLIITKLAAGDDVMPDRAVGALVRIGTVGVVERVEAYLRTAEWSGRIFGVEVLQRIKRPESEAALLRWLEGEPDREIATMIAEALCGLGAGPGVLAMLRDRLAVGRLGAVGFDLETEILAAGRMVGYEPPEEKKWLERARKQDAGMDAMREEILRGFAEHVKGGLEEEGGLVGEALLPWEGDVTMPIERGVEKVGRNDPCPCGSGKKFKKCCGK